MGSVPRAKAGVGSAVNDTTRQVGGALGVAIIGSVMASAFTPRITEVLRSVGITGSNAAKLDDNLGKVIQFAGDPGSPLNPATRETIANGAKDAFVTGMHHGVLVAAAAAFLGALIALVWLPAHAPSEDFVVQDAQEAKLEEVVAAFEPESV
jgi:hypothetical protein